LSLILNFYLFSFAHIKISYNQLFYRLEVMLLVKFQQDQALFGWLKLKLLKDYINQSQRYLQLNELHLKLFFH